MKQHYLKHTPKGLKPYCGHTPFDSAAIVDLVSLTGDADKVTCERCWGMLTATSAGDFNEAFQGEI